MRYGTRTFLAAISMIVLLASTARVCSAMPGFKVGGRVIRMEPEGADAEEYSKASWGGGLVFFATPPGPAKLFAGVFGFDFIVMLTETTEFQDSVTGLRVEQQTSQNYMRFYLGGRLGHQGHGTFRPYLEGNIALVYYNISTDVVIPDDWDRENEIRQNLDEEGKAAFGYDFAVGMEWNFNDFVYLDLGAKYLKSFNVPQQLGEGSVTVHPQYIQFYAGLNFSLGGW